MGITPDGGTIAETKTPQAESQLTISLRTLLHLCGSQYGKDFKKAVQAHGKENGAARGGCKV